MASDSTTLTFFTPSYRGDLQRFVLLRETIRHFQPQPIRHIVAVPRADVAMFRAALAGDRDLEFAVQEDLVERYFYPTGWYRVLERVLPSQSWRFSGYAGRGGWIVQQIVKLSVPEVVPAGTVAIFDSDLFVTRPFSVAEFGVGGPRRLLRAEPRSESGRHRHHMKVARQLLRLPEGSTDHHYMGSPVIWYPDWVLALRKYLEKVQGKPWQRVLFEAGVISEYSIYGVFLQEVLKPHGLLVDLTGYHRGIWTKDELGGLLRGDLLDSKDNGKNAPPLTIVVQSNLGASVDDYRAIAERCMARADS